MFLAAPVLFAVFAFLLFLRRARGPASWRTSFVWTAITVGVVTTATTEILSAFNALKPAAVFAMWLAAAILAVAAVVFSGGFSLPEIPWRRWWSVQPRGAALALAGILGGTLITALASPPNTFDSMTYHMTRVVHWIQNGSVAFYPTHTTRQLWNSPWAEYAILHLQMLSGGDHLANLVQWFASGLSLAGVSLTVRLFDPRPAIQLLGALLCATLPMAILQASSTQNDFVAASWAVCFVYCLLRLRAGVGSPLWGAVGAGCSLGLGLLTKPSILLFVTPLFIWYVSGTRGAAGFRRLARTALTVGVAAIVLTVGHAYRNTALYGSPSGPESLGASERKGIRLTNETLSVRVLISNAVRNALLHAGTPFASLNRQLYRFAEAAHGWLGLSLDDPRTSWMEFAVRKTSRHEDGAGNPLHASLLVASLIACAALARKSQQARRLAGYGISLVAGYLLFCLIFRWSIFHSRLHLPLFVLSTPFIAAVIGDLGGRKLRAALVALVSVGALPYLVLNETRPLIGGLSVLSRSRMETMFHHRPRSLSSYEGAVESLAGGSCRDIGLILPNEWQYPIWALFSQKGDPLPTLRDVEVDNETAALGRGRPFQPCAVISYRRHGEAITVSGQRWRRSWESGPLAIYRPLPDDGD
ncbi:MAG: hypothetical protein GY953_38685 [bacterium]|nr:hypothetical protein [bacterium]